MMTLTVLLVSPAANHNRVDDLIKSVRSLAEPLSDSTSTRDAPAVVQVRLTVTAMLPAFSLPLYCAALKLSVQLPKAGVGEGVAPGEPLGLGLGEGEPLGLGEGDGDAPGLGEGDGDGVAENVPLTIVVAPCLTATVVPAPMGGTLEPKIRSSARPDERKVAVPTNAPLTSTRKTVPVIKLTLSARTSNSGPSPEVGAAKESTSYLARPVGVIPLIAGPLKLASISLLLPGEGLGEGEPLGLGEGDALGEGVALGEPLGLGDGDALGLGVALGEPLGLGLGDALGLGVALGEPLGLGLGEGDALGLGVALGEPLGLGVALGEPLGLGEGEGGGVEEKFPERITVEFCSTCSVAPMLTAGTLLPLLVSSERDALRKLSTVIVPTVAPLIRTLKLVPDDKLMPDALTSKRRRSLRSRCSATPPGVTPPIAGPLKPA